MKATSRPRTRLLAMLGLCSAFALLIFEFIEMLGEIVTGTVMANMFLHMTRCLLIAVIVYVSAAYLVAPIDPAPAA